MDSQMIDPKIIITKKGHSRNLDVWIDAVDVVTGKAQTATDFVMKSISLNEIDGPAPMTLSLNNAQSLMDNLWEVGLRPSEGSGSAGSLAATQKHLQDMRTIAFRKLEITEQFKP